MAADIDLRPAGRNHQGGQRVERNVSQARGAVDYIIKPFSAAELTARVGAALRRRAEREPFVLGGLTIEYEERRVTVAAHPVRFTATEYELLRVLSVNAGQVMTYDSLIRQVRNGPESGDTDRVRTFIKQLRRKLGDGPARLAYIQNLHGVGYRMPKHRSRSLPGRRK